MTIGKQLRAKRLAKKLTQMELAVAMGTDPVYVSRIERDIAVPSIDMVRKWLKVTGGTLEIPPST